MYNEAALLETPCHTKLIFVKVHEEQAEAIFTDPVTGIHDPERPFRRSSAV